MLTLFLIGYIFLFTVATVSCDTQTKQFDRAGKETIDCIINTFFYVFYVKKNNIPVSFL